MNKFNTAITELLKEEQSSLHMESLKAMSEALRQIAIRIEENRSLDEDIQYLHGAAEELEEFYNLYS